MSRQIEGLRRHVARRAAAPAPALEPGGPEVVLFASGKGGVGTSTVAALSAIMAAGEGSPVLLVDASDGFSSLPLLLGVGQEHGSGALRGGALAAEDLLIPVGETLTLLPFGAPAQDEERLTATERRLLLRRLVPLFARYERVMVDGGSRLDPILSLCAAGVHRILAVTTTERASVAATYALVKALATHAPAVPVEVLVNRQGAGALAAYGEIRAASQRFLDRHLGYAGAVPCDECLHAGLEAGMPLQEAAVDSPAALACHEINARVERRRGGGPRAVPEARFSFWR